MKSEQELLAEIEKLRLDKAFLEGRIFELEKRVSPPPFKFDWPEPITPFIPTVWPKEPFTITWNSMQPTITHWTLPVGSGCPQASVSQ